MMLFVASGYNF